MAVQLFNLAGMACNATGTSVLTVTSALPGFSSLADAGVTDGDEVRYLVKDGNNRELGTGTYTASGTSISRDTVLQSISGGVTGTTKISLSGSSEVYLTLAAEDLAGVFPALFTLPTTDGTSGQVLTTDGSGVLSFADAGGGGGGLVPISKTTASASAAVDIDLSGGYSAYLIRLEDIVIASSGQAVWLQVSTDGGSSFDTGGTDYGWTYDSLFAGSANVNDNSDSKVILAQTVGGASGQAMSGNIWVYPSSNSRYTLILYDVVYYRSSGSIPSRSVGVGVRVSTTAATDVRFLTSFGNITSGDFHLYGIADGA